MIRKLKISNEENWKIHSKIRIPKQPYGKNSLTLISATIFWLWHQSKAIKVKLNKWDCIKLTSLYRKRINKINRQAVEWQKIFANYVSDKGWYPKYINDSDNAIAKNKQTNPNNPTEKMSRGTEWIFFQRWHTNSQKVLNITNH